MIYSHEMKLLKNRNRISKPIEGHVSPYIMERKLIKKFKEANYDKFDDYEDMILRLQPEQIEYLLQFDSKEIVEKISNMDIPNKKHNHGRGRVR